MRRKTVLIIAGPHAGTFVFTDLMVFSLVDKPEFAAWNPNVYSEWPDPPPTIDYRVSGVNDKSGVIAWLAAPTNFDRSKHHVLARATIDSLWATSDVAPKVTI